MATVPSPSRPDFAGRPTAGALVLIAVGVVMLVGNLLGAGGAALFLGIAAAFAVARFATGRYGFAVPAGVLLGFGGFVLASEGRLLPGDTGPWFFYFLGAGFLAVYLIGLRPAEAWPLVPAAVLAGFGAWLSGGLRFEPVREYAWLASYWPGVLIVVGLWLIARDRLSPPVRSFLGVLVVAAVALYGLIVVAATAGPAAVIVVPRG
jgi:hypothetical protein